MKHKITLHHQTIWDDYPYFNIKVYTDKDHLITMFQAIGPMYELYVDRLTSDVKLCLQYLLNNKIIERKRSSIFVQTYKITQSTLLKLL